MARWFGRQPETMIKLTIPELEALVAATDAMLKAGQTEGSR